MIVASFFTFRPASTSSALSTAAGHRTGRVLEVPARGEVDRVAQDARSARRGGRGARSPPPSSAPSRSRSRTVMSTVRSGRLLGLDDRREAARARRDDDLGHVALAPPVSRRSHVPPRGGSRSGRPAPAATVSRCSARNVSSSLRSALSCGPVRSRGRGTPTATDGADARRLRGQADDAVAEEHRLVHVVRDEHHRGARALQHVQEHLLQRVSRLGVESRERLVHQQHRGSTASERARATFCFMPPEICLGW